MSKIFLRTFNDSINSKTGAALPEGAPRRGTPEWLIFEEMMHVCLLELGHELIIQPENPMYPDRYDLCEKSVYVHQTKREKPNGDLFWMQMHMRELFTIDTNGWGADHSNNWFKLGVMDAKASEAFCREKSDSLLRSGISKCDQPIENSPVPPGAILVPLQIPRDYTIRNHSPITVRYFVDSLMAWAEETSTNICIKMHPNNKYDTDLYQAVDEGVAHSAHVHKVEGNIHELITRSLGLFVINSGTGFEGLIHGKPVATFGACDYSRATWNADVRRLNEARDFILNYSDEWRRIGYELVDWYWHRHAYDVNGVDTKQRLTQYLKENL